MKPYSTEAVAVQLDRSARTVRRVRLRARQRLKRRIEVGDD